MRTTWLRAMRAVFLQDELSMVLNEHLGSAIRASGEGAAGDTLLRQQAPQAGGHGFEYLPRDPVAVPLILHAQINDRDSEKAEGKRKQQRVLEHPVREAPQIAEHPQRTEHDEHSSLEKNGEKNQSKMDETIGQRASA